MHNGSDLTTIGPERNYQHSADRTVICDLNENHGISILISLTFIHKDRIDDKSVLASQQAFSWTIVVQDLRGHMTSLATLK